MNGRISFHSCSSSKQQQQQAAAASSSSSKQQQQQYSSSIAAAVVALVAVVVDANARCPVHALINCCRHAAKHGCTNNRPARVMFFRARTLLRASLLMVLQRSSI